MRFFHSIKFKMNIYTIMLVAIAVLFFSLVTYLLLAQRASMMNLDAVKLSTLKIQVTPLTAAGGPNNSGQGDSSYKLISSYVLKGDMLQRIRSGASSPFEMLAPEGIYSFEQRDIISPDMAGDQEVWVYSRAGGQPAWLLRPFGGDTIQSPVTGGAGRLPEVNLHRHSDNLDLNRPAILFFDPAAIETAGNDYPGGRGNSGERFRAPDRN